jgi:hypothetical protein
MRTASGRDYDLLFHKGHHRVVVHVYYPTNIVFEFNDPNITFSKIILYMGDNPDNLVIDYCDAVPPVTTSELVSRKAKELPLLQGHFTPREQPQLHPTTPQ